MSSRRENDAEHIGTGARQERAMSKIGERERNSVAQGWAWQGRLIAATAQTQADGEATAEAMMRRPRAAKAWAQVDGESVAEARLQVGNRMRHRETALRAARGREWTLWAQRPAPVMATRLQCCAAARARSADAPRTRVRGEPADWSGTPVTANESPPRDEVRVNEAQSAKPGQHRGRGCDGDGQGVEQVEGEVRALVGASERPKVRRDRVEGGKLGARARAQEWIRGSECGNRHEEHRADGGGAPA
eukprot:644392-Pleurochrysis_carterae.AAC.1